MGKTQIPSAHPSVAVTIWRLFDFAFERNRPRGMINAPLWCN